MFHQVARHGNGSGLSVDIVFVVFVLPLFVLFVGKGEKMHEGNKKICCTVLSVQIPFADAVPQNSKTAVFQ